MAGTDPKYDEARQVERRDPLRSGLVPQVSEEADHSSLAERVRPSRQGAAGSVGRTTKGKPPQATQQQHDRVVQRTSVQFCLFLLSSAAMTSRLSTEG